MKSVVVRLSFTGKILMCLGDEVLSFTADSYIYHFLCHVLVGARVVDCKRYTQLVLEVSDDTYRVLRHAVEIGSYKHAVWRTALNILGETGLDEAKRFVKDVSEALSIAREVLDGFSRSDRYVLEGAMDWRRLVKKYRQLGRDGFRDWLEAWAVSKVIRK